MTKLMMMVFLCVIIYPFVPAFLGKALYPKKVWDSLRPGKYVVSKHAGQMFSNEQSMRFIANAALRQSLWMLALMLPLLNAVIHEETTLLTAGIIAFPFLLVFNCAQALIMWALSGVFTRAYS
jgi:hypothetical protein